MPRHGLCINCHEEGESSFLRRSFPPQNLNAKWLKIAAKDKSCHGSGDDGVKQICFLPLSTDPTVSHRTALFGWLANDDDEANEQMKSSNGSSRDNTRCTFGLGD